MFPAIFEPLKASAEVKAILGDPPRVYHNSAPQTPVPPYSVWLIVGSEPQNHLDSPANADRVVVQIDMYHATEAGIKALARAVRRALEGSYTYVGMIIDERDEGTKLYRITLQFDCWIAAS